MSLYQCEKCGCIENTALGWYHCRHTDWCKVSAEDKGKALCSECGPKEHSDGTPTEYGKWHGRFEKKVYPLDTLYTDKEGNVRRKLDDKYPHEDSND